jgi:hypothetical protein
MSLNSLPSLINLPIDVTFDKMSETSQHKIKHSLVARHLFVRFLDIDSYYEIGLGSKKKRYKCVKKPEIPTWGTVGPPTEVGTSSDAGDFQFEFQEDDSEDPLKMSMLGSDYKEFYPDQVPLDRLEAGSTYQFYATWGAREVKAKKGMLYSAPWKELTIAEMQGMSPDEEQLETYAHKISNVGFDHDVLSQAKLGDAVQLQHTYWSYGSGMGSPVQSMRYVLVDWKIPDDNDRKTIQYKRIFQMYALSQLAKVTA